MTFSGKKKGDAEYKIKLVCNESERERERERSKGWKGEVKNACCFGAASLLASEPDCTSLTYSLGNKK